MPIAKAASSPNFERAAEWSARTTARSEFEVEESEAALDGSGGRCSERQEGGLVCNRWLKH